MMLPSNQTSRQDTTWAKHAHLRQLPLAVEPGSRRWVRDNLSIRVADSRADRAEVADIIRTRHYLRTWPAPPKTLLLSYIASLGGDGAAAAVMIGLLPTNYGPVLQALDLHQAEVLQLVRCWRADDLGAKVAPDLMPLVLRRTVRRLAADWADRKCANLVARPRLLVTYADPSVGHDGRLYEGAGAVALGRGSGGKLMFAWALDDTLRDPLRQYARARAERRKEASPQRTKQGRDHLALGRDHQG